MSQFSESTPPHDEASEKVVLGSMMSKIETLQTCSDLLEAKHFYKANHRALFEYLRGFRNSSTISLVILLAGLSDHDKLSAMGGKIEILNISQCVTFSDIEQYAHIIKEKFILREIMNLSISAYKHAISGPSNVKAFLEDCRNNMYKLDYSEAYDCSSICTDPESSESYLKILCDEMGMVGDKPKGILTGFEDLDNLLGCLKDGQLIILAGATSMGKSTLAMNIIKNVITQQSISTALITLEMSSRDLWEQMVSSESMVDLRKIINKSLESKDMDAIEKADTILRNSPLVVDDCGFLKIGDLRSKVRRLKEKYDIKFLVIDHLHLITGSSVAASRHLDISEMTRTMKSIAMEFKITVMCLAQLSRKIEERPGHLPQLSDLRESGSIEQDADIVLFIRRRGYYDPNDHPMTADILIAKHRRGPTGMIHLTFLSDRATFANYTSIDKMINEIRNRS